VGLLSFIVVCWCWGVERALKAQASRPAVVKRPPRKRSLEVRKGRVGCDGVVTGSAMDVLPLLATHRVHRLAVRLGTFFFLL